MHPLGIKFEVTGEDFGEGPDMANAKRLLIHTSSGVRDFVFSNSKPDEVIRVGQALKEIGEFVKTLP